MTVVTLTTDFGSGYYVGEMKGVIKKVNPDADVVDVTHGVSRHNILEGAFILSRAWRYFPKNTVHVGVVDPGVGGERKALAVETTDCFFVGPDNGLLRWALKDQDVTRMICLDTVTVKERAGLEGVSSTFHGRDVFAPAAALIAKGVDVDTVGERVREVEPLDVGEDKVVHVDGFGNIVTTVARAVEPGMELKVVHGGERYDAVCATTFCDADEGELIVLYGSHGLLEVDVNHGDAGKLLGAKPGDEIRVEHAG